MSYQERRVTIAPLEYSQRHSVAQMIQGCIDEMFCTGSDEEDTSHNPQVMKDLLRELYTPERLSVYAGPQYTSPANPLSPGASYQEFFVAHDGEKPYRCMSLRVNQDHDSEWLEIGAFYGTNNVITAYRMLQQAWDTSIELGKRGLMGKIIKDKALNFFRKAAIKNEGPFFETEEVITEIHPRTDHSITLPIYRFYWEHRSREQ